MNALQSISPADSRKPDVEGCTFRLADRNFWDLALPTILIKPRFVPVPDEPGLTAARVKVEIDTVWDYPQPARAKVQALIDAAGSDSPTFPAATLIEAGIVLLLLCHDLPLNEAIALFELTMPEAEELAIGMLRMFQGDRPESKPSEEPTIPENED